MQFADYLLFDTVKNILQMFRNALVVIGSGIFIDKVGQRGMCNRILKFNHIIKPKKNVATRYEIFFY